MSSVSLSKGVAKGLNDGSKEGLGEGSVGLGKGAGVVGEAGEGLADGDVESCDKGEKSNNDDESVDDKEDVYLLNIRYFSDGENVEELQDAREMLKNSRRKFSKDRVPNCE
ncbi:hypothetical protein PVK06_018177 [Gossypium arboreum]|uniref:Uncharacterized protein n=1 Tax=Gossypium arboreum TaxID=29729 RepID=A0ABR0Q4R2_GOSAR|nr:hypothetical protein PVK06_018177 [Gossypium arboreum]